jgi:glutamate carboxypeptidase
MSTAAAVDIAALHRYLVTQQPALVRELETFVSLESGSRDREGVNRVGVELAAALATLGFAVERRLEREAGDHLVARRAGAGHGRLLVLIHLDTVWPRGSFGETPFRVDSNQAWGPGVLDMKGGWVVLLGALRALAEVGWNGLASTTVFVTADEELGSPTGRRWIEEEARRADWALVLEPARENGALVIQRGMVGALALEVTGATAHTTNRDRGASAIRAIAGKVLALEGLNDPEAGVLVNVGTISGGSARQVVPDHASISIDLRAPSAELAEVLLARVRAIAEETTVAGTRAILFGGITRPAFPASTGTLRLLRLAQRCGAELGLTLEGAATRAGSDGNFTAALGVPTLDGLGPEGANACSRDEYVLLNSLPRRAALLAGIIAGLPVD